MISHESPISGIACWQDQYVATAGYDNRVVLWAAGSGRAIARTFHDHLVNQCTFSPDGRWLITASSDYTARLWEVPSLRLRAVLREHEDDVEMAAFHPDRDLVATASRDHRVRVFGLDGRLQRTFAGHTADVVSVTWSEDGDRLVSSSDDGTIKTWSLGTGALVADLDLDGVETDTIVLTPEGVIYAGNDKGEIVMVAPDGRPERIVAHDAGVKRLVLAAEEGLLVSLSYDRVARLWDVSGGLPVLRQETALPDDVWPRSAAFRQGSQLVFGTFGQTYRTYDFGRAQWQQEEVAATPGLNAVSPAADGSCLAVGDSGTVWRLERDGRRCPVSRPGSLCNFLTPAGEVVLTGGQLGRVFDARTGTAVHQHRSPLNCATSFRRDGRLFAVVGAYTGEGLLFEVEGNRVVHRGDLPLLENAVKGVAAGERLLLAVCADRTAVWWDLGTLEPVAVRPAAHDRIINGCVALTGDVFATVGRDLMLRIWDGPQLLETIPTPHGHSVKCVSANGTGDLVATGSYDGTIAVLERGTGAWRELERPSMSGISSLCFDAGAGEFVASCYDGQLYRVPA
jgi:WD40 repeat protein